MDHGISKEYKNLFVSILSQRSILEPLKNNKVCTFKYTQDDLIKCEYLPEVELIKFSKKNE